MRSSEYDRDFYARLDATAEPSAQVIVPLVQQLVGAHSVVDLGCGDGGWLATFAHHGADEILGMDGDWVSRAHLKIPSDQFVCTDLSQAFDVKGQFQLAVSLEVAEHLPPERAQSFVEILTSAAPVVLFSSAVPDQGGTGHVNEQWPAYWLEQFERKGFHAIDCIREQVWNDRRVAWWYKQNLMLFACDDALDQLPRLAELRRRKNTFPLAVVHPDLFSERASQHRQHVQRLSSGGLRAWLRSGRQLLEDRLRDRRGS